MTVEQEREAEEALPPFFEMIGRVASNWSYLEQTVDDFIWTLAKVDHAKGACITSQIQSIEWKLRSVIAISELSGCSGATIRKLKGISRDAASLVTRRNRIVHDPLLYAFASHEVMASRMVANKTLQYSMVPADLNEMKEVVLAIGRLRTALIIVRNGAFSEISEV